MLSGRVMISPKAGYQWLPCACARTSNQTNPKSDHAADVMTADALDGQAYTGPSSKAPPPGAVDPAADASGRADGETTVLVAGRTLSEKGRTPACERRAVKPKE